MDGNQSQLAQNVGIENTSGLLPLGHAVLVRTYEPEIQRGLIQIPDAVAQSMQQMDQRATVIAVGPNCWKDESQPRAKPGDRVLVTKYAGYVAGGSQTKDGVLYRLVNDRDIFCQINFTEADRLTWIEQQRGDSK